MMRINFDILRRAWKQSWPRKLALSAGVMAVGGAGLAALESQSGAIPAPAKAACCTGAVSVGDSRISPAIGADKDFFEVPTSPPSVMFLLGNNNSMQEYPTYLPEAYTEGYYTTPATPKVGDRGFNDPKIGHFINTGCSDPKLLAAMNWFDKGSGDPAKNGSLIYDDDSDFGNSKFFDPSLFYHSRGWRIAINTGGADAPNSLSPTFRGFTVTSADAAAMCQGLMRPGSGSYWTWNSQTTVYAECLSCLTTVGWWRGPIIPQNVNGTGDLGPTQKKDEPPMPPEAKRKWILSGRVLNVRPPKFAVARKVLKDVINSATNVRMGVATFGEDRGWYDPPTIASDIRPRCDAAYPTIIEKELDRRKLMDSVNTVKFRNIERSIGEALFGIGAYYSSQIYDQKWAKWFAQPIQGTKGIWGWPGQSGGGTYDNPYTGQEGAMYAKQADEWLKGPAELIDNSTGTNVTYTHPGQRWEVGGQNRSVCFGCQVSSTVVLTDGAPKYDNSVPITKIMSLLVDQKAKHATPDHLPIEFHPEDPEHNPNVGGINYCDQFEKAPGQRATKVDCDYVDYNWPHGLGVGNKNFMDDVSYFLAHSDLRDDMAGVQSMRTYTVGYGDNNPMLQSIALAGKGKFYRANNGPELRQALMDALGDIKQLSTSFASANISGVQMGGMQSATFVPRFVPRRNRPYEGHLYRFFYFSEFAQGCQPSAPGAPKHKRDLNQDNDCDDTFFLDKPANFSGGEPDINTFTNLNIVQENADGIWVKRDTASIVDGALQGGTPAEPFWDLGETVGNRKASQRCDLNHPLDPNKGRCIFTLIDRDNDGKFTAEDNPPVEFHEDNLEQLKGYLLAGGDTFCATLFSKQLKTWEGSAANQTDCAKQLVRFVRGMDVFDFDGDSNREEERPCADNAKPEDAKSCKLADIFHSAPVTVEPPVDPFLCSLGLSSQCASTLYSDFQASVSSERLCGTGVNSKPCYKATPMATPISNEKRNGVYDDYVKEPKVARRDRIALVGSNGGMLHAVHVGTAKPEVPGQKKKLTDSIYDVGTGQELWAFVPPDLMPKLGLMVLGHEYFVDGTPMVRDIWADGAPSGTLTQRNRDGVKQLDEFRTIAVVGERSGGQRFMALDVTDPYAMFKAVQNPGDTSIKPFRWMFPNACDKESLTMGQSWANFAPKPPPIGPVRIKAEATSAVTDQDRGYEERWVTVLNGGYSADLTRGRGVYMVDAWTGEKLWSAEALPGVATSDYGNVLNKMQPVVASAALVDYGKGESLRADHDGFFDTMIVGDMGGQVWTFRMHEPGELDKDTGLVKNWFGARSLEVQRDVSTPNNEHQKAPFFHVASSIIQPSTGWLRAFVGTGDRQHLRTSPGTDCSADDLLACIRLKCNVKASFVGLVNGQQRTSVVEYKDGSLVSGTSQDTWQDGMGAACTGSKMELTELTLLCPAAAYGTAVFPTNGVARTYSTQSHCSNSGSGWECESVPLNTSEKSDLKLSATEKITVGTNRYFGFVTYGGPGRTFATAADAVKFDGMRVTDKQNAPCGDNKKCSLKDVTIPNNLYTTQVDANGVSQRYIKQTDLNKVAWAGENDLGWFITYTNTFAERTATGSSVLAGVAFWSSFSPNTTPGADACSLSGMGDTSFSWQADVITGRPDYAMGFQAANGTGWMPSRASKAAAPPSEPTPVVSISESGSIRFGVALSSPGGATEEMTLSQKKGTTPEISWVEVPRNLHECRHENSEACGDGSESAATPPP